MIAATESSGFYGVLALTGVFTFSHSDVDAILNIF